MSKATLENIQSVPNRILFKDMFFRLKTIRENSIKLYALMVIYTIYVVSEPYIYMQITDTFISGKLVSPMIGEIIKLIVVW